MPESDEDFFFRSTDNSVHWTLGDVISSTLDAAVATDRAEAADERERLLYVACTRALDLLVLPEASWAPDGGWAKFFDLGQSVLEEIKSRPRQRPEPIRPAAETNKPASISLKRASASCAWTPRIEWRRPSSADIDRELLDRATIDVGDGEGDFGAEAVVLGAGALRGIILHKLMEELLTRIAGPGSRAPDRSRIHPHRRRQLSRDDSARSIRAGGFSAAHLFAREASSPTSRSWFRRYHSSERGQTRSSWPPELMLSRSKRASLSPHSIGRATSRLRQLTMRPTRANCWNISN